MKVPFPISVWQFVFAWLNSYGKTKPKRYKFADIIVDQLKTPETLSKEEGVASMTMQMAKSAVKFYHKSCCEVDFKAAPEPIPPLPFMVEHNISVKMVKIP
jgi:hypothetical protein